MKITESRLHRMIIEEMVLSEVLSGEAGAGNPTSMAPGVPGAKNTRLVESVIAIRESDVKDHFAGSIGSKYEMSAQGTYISHVPSMQEDEEDEGEDNCSESLKTRERMITIVR